MRIKLLEDNNFFIVIIVIVILIAVFYSKYMNNKLESFIIENKNNKLKKINSYSKELQNKIINMQINNKYQITNLLNNIIKINKLSTKKSTFKKLKKVILETRLPKYLHEDINNYLKKMDMILDIYYRNTNLFSESENIDNTKTKKKNSNQINYDINLNDQKKKIIKKVLKQPDFSNYNMKKPSPININISFNDKNQIDSSNIGENILHKNKMDNKNLSNLDNKFRVVNPVYPVLYGNNNLIPDNYASVSWTTNPDFFLPKTL